MTSRTGGNVLLGLGALLWLGGVTAGFSALLAHQSAPGVPAAPPATWPQTLPQDGPLIARDSARPTLLVFLHPHCPCSRATVEELNRLLARCDEPVRTVALCYADPALGADWARTATWRQVEAIPGVELRADPQGAVARAFGVRTSGQVLLYGLDGGLQFQGGITPSRGHAGDSAGRAALQALLREEPAAPGSAVYGCALLTPSAELPAEETPAAATLAEEAP